MPKKRRDELKGRFQKGMLPDEEDFRDLIDSSVNPLEDGFEVNKNDGIKVSALPEQPLITVYAGQKDNVKRQWQLNVPEAGNALNLVNLTQGPLLSFGATKKHIGINKETPEHTLDVEGVVSSTGRIGAFKDNSIFEDEVIADGKWKTILSGLEACNMFEVVAGVRGKSGSGNIAILHAIAMNAFNPLSKIPFLSNHKRKIKHQHAYFSSRWDRICLRWVTNPKDKSKYSLQIRTVRDYTVMEPGKATKKYKIKFRITQLWLEHTLEDCEVSVDQDSNGAP